MWNFLKQLHANVICCRLLVRELQHGFWFYEALRKARAIGIQLQQSLFHHHHLSLPTNLERVAPFLTLRIGSFLEIKPPHMLEWRHGSTVATRYQLFGDVFH